MRGTARHVVAFASIFAGACGTGDTNVDPGDLELRDLLGVSPDVATAWSAEQKSSARRVFVDALDDERAEAIPIESYRSGDQLVHSLALVDAKRLDAGDDALALVRISGVQLTRRRVAIDSDAVLVDALAKASGHETGDVVVTREPRLTVAAAYVDGTPARLIVNPVVLTVFDEGEVALESPRRTRSGVGQTDDFAKPSPKAIAANGNPYSFYGSIAECAYAQRLRCEACLPNSSCTEAITSSTPNDECTKLAENDGRGYFLLCINLSLAITSVDQCAKADANCTIDVNAANDLSQLEANSGFLVDASCASGLDGCLAKIYGSSNGTFPGLVDGGVGTPPPNPPRDPDISCGDSCSDNNSNCEASPSCDCSGPSCNNSLSCDSTCASSNDQSGCGGGCSSCESEGGGSSGGGGGGCGGSSGGSSGSSGGGGCGDGCGGSSSGGSSSGGGCGGGDSGGGCGGGGGSCGGGGGGGSCGGGGGGGGCQVAKQEPSAAFAVGFSLAWAFLPIPVAAMIRRRSRKQKKTRDEGDAKEEVPS